MAERLRRDPLPPQWSYGVKADGRIFFINEETRSTTWLHPVTGKAISSGWDDRVDLPPGWQEGITREGAAYFMNHHTGETTFNNPITQQPEADDEFFLIDRTHETPPYHRPNLAPLQMPPNNSTPGPAQSDPSQYDPALSPSSPVYAQATVPDNRTTPNQPTTPTSPTSGDRPSFRKRVVPKTSAPSLKRRRDAVTSMEGWLFKQDSGALKAWRKRWCVLADYCLFYYKGSDQTRSESGSILLPSYQISPIGPQDKINRKFAFKCEHDNMRTYYLAAETQVDMNQWIRALKLAANVQLDRSQQYGEDETGGFGDYRSPSQNGGHNGRDDEEEDWLFKSSKDLNGALPDDYEDNRDATAPPQNGFDPDGRLPREPDEADGRYHNGNDYVEGAPDGYWEARERYIQNHGHYPEDNRPGQDEMDHAVPPAIYDYPPDEDIDGYSSPEEVVKRDRFHDDDDDDLAHRLPPDSEQVDRDMSDREQFGSDRGRNPGDRPDDRKPRQPRDNIREPEPDRGERDRYDSDRSREDYQGLSSPDAGEYTKLRFSPQQDRRVPGERGEDRERDQYNSLSESDQDRRIVPVEERLVSAAAPVQEAGYDPRETSDSSHGKQDSKSASLEDERGTARSRDSHSSRASQDKHGGRHGDRQGGEPRHSWDRGSESLSSRDEGQQRGRSPGGRGRRAGGGGGRPPPHSPGQYPESYNTLPRPRSKSRERSNTDEGRFPNDNRGQNQDGSLDRRQMPHYDSSTTDSLPSPSGDPTSHPLGGGGRRHPHDDPRRVHSLDHRRQRPHRDSDSQSDSRPSPRDERSPQPRSYRDLEGRVHNPRDMHGTRSLDRNQRPPHRSSMDSPPRASQQSATLPHDYRSADARRRDYAGAQDQPDADISKMSTPTSSAPGSVDGRGRRDPETGSLRREDPRGDPRRSDPRGDPRRGDPQSDPRHNRRRDPRGDPRHRDPGRDERFDPRRSDPRMGDSRRGDPRQGDPRKGDPRERDPRDDPRGEPRRGDPRDDQRGRDPRDDPRQRDPRGDPRQRDPRGDPRQRDPRRGDPRDDPRRGDPRHDPRRGDPRGDPRQHDPRGDPRQRDPRGDPRQRDPRGDPRRSDPRGDPRQSDPRQSDPRGDPRRSDPHRGGPRDDRRREMEAVQGRRPPEPLHFKFPKTGEMYPGEVTPEQRSFLQSPLAQPNQELLTPEQRADINSPMVYQRKEADWPTSRPEAYYKAKERQAESAEHQPHADYIPQPVEAVIQRSTPTNATFASAPPLESQDRYPEEQKRTSNYDRPRRFASPITEEEVEGTTEPDIAPRRARNAGHKRRSDRNTLERNEFDTGDQLAPLTEGSGMSKGPREPTSRFKKWQMKAQPYILLSTGIRLRLSIAAGDLLGKSHEELVLLLIQLRRDQSNLERWLEMIDQEMALLMDPTSSPPGSPSRIRARHGDSLHRRSNPNLSEDREFFGELSLEREEVARELEISRPLVHLVDNLVRMGSLYGGENQMIAQEFYRDKVQKDLNYIQPKKLIEFSRRLEEEKLERDLKGELEQIQTAEDRLLEDKLNHLHKLDKKLQELSAQVSLLKEDKDKIETSLDRLGREMERHWDDGPEILGGMEDQQRRLERDLVKVRTQLAYGTKELEEIAAENGKIEYEVTLLRSKLDGRHHRNAKSPHEGATTKERLQMENEVTRVQSLLDSLGKQRNLLVNQMQTLRTGPTEANREKFPRRRHEHSPRTPKQYTVTDLDTMVSRDLSASSPAPMATANEGISKSAPPLRRRGDSIKKVRQIKEQQVQQSPVLESVASSTAQSSYHASPQILHPQPRYQQLPARQVEPPRLSPDWENQYYSGPSTDRRRGDASPQERVRSGPTQSGWHDEGHRVDKRQTFGGYGKRSKGPRPDSKYHTISRTGDVVHHSPMRRTRSVPDREGLMADDGKSSAMDRLMPGSPYKNTSYDPYHGAVSDTEVESSTLRSKKKSLRVSDGAQQKTRGPALRHLRSARAQTLPGRFANGTPHTPPVLNAPKPQITPDPTNSWDEGAATNQDELPRRQPERNRRHTFSGQPLGPRARPFAKGAQDDIAIHELQKALIDPDEFNELVIPEPSGPRPSDIVSGKYKPIDVDESTGGGLLGMPAKIVIPERYLPDEEDEEEPTMTAEEREKHEERVDRITKMLSAHSLSTWDQAGGFPEAEQLRQKVEEEKQARQEVLTMRRALAQEVKEQSKVMAARSMRMTTETQQLAAR
ncbi:uncharacterized protein LOC119721637 isoform X2 [Patiria miniata]|uniref:Uncharacterized protein n=1 Tax=Patiria miniata TaxID=46514 RepID=A0A913Z9Q2_PATMI|nr:uncharacterized protein LOC119721637 isoform X2 [Patiria miniata]